MAANIKEARRRKIIERGSERLALITGRIHNLPPPHPPASSSLPDSDSLSQPLNTPRISLSNDTVSPQGEADDSDPILLKHDPVSDPHHTNASNSSSQTPLLEHKNEIPSIPTTEDEETQPPPGSSIATSENDQMQPLYDLSVLPSGSGQQSELRGRDSKSFTLGDISSAINTSKMTRLCCSIVAALLVVLSYLGFPLLGSNFVKTILSFRPLYLVLVTNVTVVVAQLLSNKQRGSERATGRQNETSPDGDRWIEQLSKALEIGLVIQNVMDALFMDCASYAIIVICGLSLVQLFS